jgi:hypothetical protein
VANPRALVQPLREAASPAATTGVVYQARQPLQQSVGEARQLVGRKVFEHTKIDNELDGGFIVPNVRTAEDPARDDLEIRVWSRGNALGHEVLLTKSLCEFGWCHGRRASRGKTTGSVCCDPATSRHAETERSSGLDL